jgi:hypothetical protein
MLEAVESGGVRRSRLLTTENFLLRWINVTAALAAHKELESCYTDTGRPSVDPKFSSSMRCW